MFLVGAFHWLHVGHQDMIRQNIGTIYPARAGPDGRSAIEQAGYQLAALLITVAIAVSSGAFTGMIVQTSFFQQPGAEGLYSDHLDWDDVEEDDDITEHHAASHDHHGPASVHMHGDDDHPIKPQHRLASV